MIHKWRREAEGNQKPVDKGFLQAPAGTAEEVVFELAGIKVRWPLTQIDRAIPWLRALQS